MELFYPFGEEIIKHAELAKNAGFQNIGEKVVQHQARKYGKTKFGYDRFINGFLDLLTIWFVSKFGKRPMHLFGLLSFSSSSPKLLCETKAPSEYLPALK